MIFSRRHFIQQSVVTAAAASLPIHQAKAFSGTALESAQFESQCGLCDPVRVRALALRAVDAARSAGATYADVRLTRTVLHTFMHKDDSVVGAFVSDTEDLAVGVRALVNGYWGFAASPYWTMDEIVHLSKEAVAQAKQNALGSARHVDLGTIPAASGTWTTPGIDPFSISIEEKIDFMNGWRQAINDAPKSGIVARPVMGVMNFRRQECAMASTEGAYTMQTMYRSAGHFEVMVQTRGRSLGMRARGLVPQGRGWEVFTDAQIRSQIPQLFAEAAEQAAVAHQYVDIGRYDVVFDAAAAAKLVDKTIGTATQVDRALGYEANATGTSYLGPDPLERLGTFVVGAPQLTITANRSLPGGTATVKWDDEGVAPADFTLVKDGVLVDYQTTREQSAWLAPWYHRQGIPVQSHGCAASASASVIQIQHTPNLAMTPSPAAASFADLVAATPKGLAIMGGQVSADFQASSGYGSGGLVRKITNGKLGPVLFSAGYLFHTTELWKKVIALGGPDSVVNIPAQHGKGQPSQEYTHTVAAVPVVVKNVSVIDVSRRA